jgi:cyanophycinase
MNGTVLLEGGAEFGGRMAEPDRRALELAGGMQARLVVIAAAAAPDHNHLQAGANAVRWFKGLGAQQVKVSALIDPGSAERRDVVDELAQAQFIYMLGGFPGHLCHSLAGSPAWQAMLLAYEKGAVLGGSSAGAMVLAEHLYDPQTGSVVPGLGLLPGTLVIPHHNNFGRGWAPRLAAQLPHVRLVGIDERTGILDDGPGGLWGVYGQGSALVYSAGKIQKYTGADRFRW